jgi:hypothetical protein
MAFARIFAHAQDRLNAVPQRFADFYQSKMLRAEPRAAEPDNVFLTIVPRPGARPLVPKGALFAAGKDKKGAAIGFAADAALAVTGTALAQVRRWTPATGADGGAVRIDAAIFAAGPDGAVGAAPDGLAGAAPAVAVAPAIVLAAPLLAVVGAARRVVLTLACTGLTDSITSPSLSSSLDVSVSTAKGWLDLGAAGVAVAWTRDDSSIAVTVELGADVPPIVPCPPGSQAPDAPAIRLALRQDAADPAAQPWALFGGLGLTGAILEIAVRDLNGLEVSASSMPASAAGAAPFGLQPMPGGTLRIDHPALAAAPLDRLVLTLDWASLPPDPKGFGGYYREYVVGADRQLHDRSPFDNDSFTVTMAAPVPGWPASKILPLFAAADPVAGNGIPDPPPPDIFAAQGFAPPPPPAPLAPLAASSWFAAAAGPAAEPPPEPVPGQEDEAPQGAFYVELILAGPAEGFGDSLYNANMTYATALLAHAQVPPPGPGVLKRLGTAIASLAAKAGKAIAAAAAWVMGALKAIVLFPAKLLRGLDGIDGSDPGPAPEPAPGPPPPPPSSADPMPVLPNPPFRPILSGIRLDCAWRVSDANGVALYHETPLEGLSEAIVPAGAPLFAPLPIVPCLDIALDGARPGERQSLLVRLGQPADGPASAPAYFYRTAAGWQKLPAAGALADGTGGLQATGIIAFALPPDAAPIAGADDALWLRAQFPGGTVPPIVAISADALSATRIPGGDAAVVAPVAAGTIARPPGLAGIAQVTQPLASAGGRAAEDISTLRGRVAERVRHRGRGVTGWDIERIVLDDFPAILKARVVPTGAPPGSGPAGDTIVAVVPGPGGADAVDPLRPRASPQLRGAIEARLGACASPFARLRVVDPFYVAVDVEARLIVRGEPGDAIETALAALLSPWADPGLDLDDDSDGEALRAAIAFFLRSRGDVVRIEHLAVALRDAAPPAPWRVPVAGTLDILAVAAAPVISSW